MIYLEFFDLRDDEVPLILREIGVVRIVSSWDGGWWEFEDGYKFYINTGPLWGTA